MASKRGNEHLATTSLGALPEQPLRENGFRGYSHLKHQVLSDVAVQLLSPVARQAPLSMGFSRQEY